MRSNPEREAALQRLDAAYRPEGYAPLDEGSAWAAVSRASVFAIIAGQPDVPKDDALDALRMLPEVQARLERAEASMIGAARRSGATWDEIGLALGYAAPSARQGGETRARRLSRRIGQPPRTTNR